MQPYQQAIEVNGIKLFEKAGMPAESSHEGSLDESACFMYMLSGSKVAIEPLGKTQISATEGLLKRCGNYVSHFSSDGMMHMCEGVAIYFNPGFIKKIYHNEIPNFLHKSPAPFNTQKILSSTLLQQYINNLLPYFDNPELMDEEMASLKIKELILILLKSQNRTSVLEFFSELFSAPRKVIMNEIVENHIYTDISIEQLAYLSAMSLSTFKREFKKYFGDSPARYIRLRKVEKSQSLLQNTTLQIQEVAEQSGFNELSSFSHTFQKIVGCSPSDYRVTQINK